MRGPTISDKLPSTELNQFRILHRGPEGLSKPDKNAEKGEAIYPRPIHFRSPAVSHRISSLSAAVPSPSSGSLAWKMTATGLLDPRDQILEGDDDMKGGDKEKNQEHTCDQVRERPTQCTLRVARGGDITSHRRYDLRKVSLGADKQPNTSPLLAPINSPPLPRFFRCPLTSCTRHRIAQKFRGQGRPPHRICRMSY